MTFLRVALRDLGEVAGVIDPASVTEACGMIAGPGDLFLTSAASGEVATATALTRMARRMLGESARSCALATPTGSE
jgi:hypothetical protein